MGLLTRRSKKDETNDNIDSLGKPNNGVGNSASTEESFNKPREGHYNSNGKGEWEWKDLSARETSKNANTNTQPTVISARANADKFKVSEMRDSDLHGTTGYRGKRSTTVPTARESAYSGTPRYDWIDVEAAAAIKIQSVYRRHVVLSQLEKEGKSTASMRNNVRARNAQKKSMNSEDVPSLFRFCGLGLMFADATGEDTVAMNEATTAASDDKNFNSKLNKDMKARTLKLRQKRGIVLEESVEVVDHLEDEEDDAPQIKQKKKFRLFKRKGQAARSVQ
jgi:hypothetical protein